MRMLVIALLGLFSTLTLSAQSGSITVRGKVSDKQGEPVIGASIIVTGTPTGTITDIDGNYSVNAAGTGTLEIKYLGYKTQTILIQNRSTINVILEEDAEALSEVVVIGYGSVRKSDATGSLTAIKPEEMNKGLMVNAQDMIMGKIAGVNVSLRDGTPGGGNTIRIRGGSSLNASNDPLIVIDGLLMDNDGIRGVANLLSTINPNDVETFTVLKDASATAIYGSRASNGVVIITTKKGTANTKARVSYNGNFSVGIIPNTLEVLSGDEFRDYVTKLAPDRPNILATLGTSNTNWQDEVFRTALSTDHNLNITGGSKYLPYRVSAGFTNENGIVETSNFERYTLAVSLTPTFFDNHLKFNANVKSMAVKNRFADGGAVGNAIGMDPTQSVRSDDPVFQNNFAGFWQWYTIPDPNTGKVAFNTLATRNPISLLELRRNASRAYDLNGALDLDYTFHGLPELTAHVTLGLNLSDGKQIDTRTKSHPEAFPYATMNVQTGFKRNTMLTYYGQYAKEIEKHNFSVMAGAEWQHFYRSTTDNFTYPDGAEGRQPTSDAFRTQYRLASFMGRVNYGFDNRYLLTGTIRRDGTSRFAKDNQWGWFPAAAFAWKITEEGFMKEQQLFSELKMRLGYGITGQQNLNLGRNDGGDFPTRPLYILSQSGAYYPVGGEQGSEEYIQTLKPNAYNPDLKWEETTTWNAGFDYSIMNGRFSGAIDYYFRKTKDLINIIDIPAGTNFKNSLISNIGSLENQGIEFSINAKAISNRDLVWDLGFNISHNFNKITQLTSTERANQIVINLTDRPSAGTGNYIKANAVGLPTNSFHVFQQVYDDNGRPIEGLYVDRNGDGIINNEDRYFYKNPAPDIAMGFSSKVIYKNFDLGITMRASIGNYMYNDVAANNAIIGESAVISTTSVLTNRPLSAFETNFTQGGLDHYLSDYYIQNASFLRCDNITLGYSFENLFNAIPNGRIFVTAQNPFVITKYGGLDPEINNGLDNNIYPRPFMSIIGLSLNF